MGSGFLLLWGGISIKFDCITTAGATQVAPQQGSVPCMSHLGTVLHLMMRAEWVSFHARGQRVPDRHLALITITERCVIYLAWLQQHQLCWYLIYSIGVGGWGLRPTPGTLVAGGYWDSGALHSILCNPAYLSVNLCIGLVFGDW